MIYQSIWYCAWLTVGTQKLLLPSSSAYAEFQDAILGER